MATGVQQSLRCTVRYAACGPSTRPSHSSRLQSATHSTCTATTALLRDFSLDRTAIARSLGHTRQRGTDSLRTWYVNKTLHRPPRRLPSTGFVGSAKTQMPYRCGVNSGRLLAAANTPLALQFRPIPSNDASHDIGRPEQSLTDDGGPGAKHQLQGGLLPLRQARQRSRRPPRPGRPAEGLRSEPDAGRDQRPRGAGRRRLYVVSRSTPAAGAHR